MQYVTVEATRPEPFEIVLRPESGWRSLELASLWQYRDLFSLLVWRDFVSRYRQTILGPLWFIIQPLSMTLVFAVVFGKIAGLSTDGLPPVLFYLCGQLGWNYFAQNLSSNSATFVVNAALFSKVYFPRLVIPLAAVVSNLFAFAIQVAMFLCFYLYFKYSRGAAGFGMQWQVILLPLLVLQTAILSLGVGLILSALTAKYRDLTHLTALILQVWMYATPVIYPLSKIPPQWQWIALVNPMTPIVEGFRLLLLGVGTLDAVHVVCSIATTLALTFIGLMLFSRIEKTFVDIV